MTKRVTFVTIGQSPRPETVPELTHQVRTPLAAEENGALEGLDRNEIADPLAAPRHPCARAQPASPLPRQVNRLARRGEAAAEEAQAPGAPTAA